MDIPFVKMHGCGNDFIVLDERAGSFGLSRARAAALADRRLGIGCDQLISLEPAPDGADVFMRIRNPDGGEAGACGNATRCVSFLLFEEDGRARHVIRTVAGDLPSIAESAEHVTVDMGPARLEWRDVPLAAPAETLHLDLAAGPVGDPAALSMGNPHATFFVDDLSAVPVEAVGPILERAPIFPDRANIGFAEMRGRGEMRLRVWERDAGLTLACGSGACAAWVNAVRRGYAERRGIVIVDGGKIEIFWREDGHVLMGGPATVAYRGTIDLSALPA